MGAVNVTDQVDYEFAERPQTGETMQVAPGVFWLRMYLPFALSHINLWLLDEGSTWSAIDTGVGVDNCKDIWKKTFAGLMQGRPLKRIFVTHLHPDHIGCAGWLAGHFDAPLWMSRDEYLLARILVADTGRVTPEEGDRFYTAAGFQADQLDHYHNLFGMFGKYVCELPESFRRVRDGDRISIGRYEWQIIVGKGHSPEHLCFYSEELNILISGDQLLPTISSNVSVFPTEPAADPLADWLSSLQVLKSRVPADVLVLPAHGKPFRGAHFRLDALIAEHQSGLQKLETACEDRKRAIDVFPVLFKSKINNSNLIMATGESIAHLNYLRNLGRITVERDENGVDWYSRSTKSQETSGPPG
jgi:glyoxylase-like metal-dependent hydrolase (beta-lactamase superfamily II)